MNISEKERIDNMSYEDMVRQWRFDDIESPQFKGMAGSYFEKVMFHKRDKLKPGEAVKISKRIGWR